LKLSLCRGVRQGERQLLRTTRGRGCGWSKMTK
jgi:hypothetical protein